MALKIKIIDVNASNLIDHPGVICFINPKNETYKLKIDWLKYQYINGLKIKLLYIEGEKCPKGFIEYVPGEYCWRAVSAAGYMFIHCIWTNGKKYQHLGLGKTLIEEVEKDAYDMLGVAVMTSDGPFMANRELKSYKDAQETPAPYSVFNLCKDDRILADRYISVTRFQNILNKESGK